MSYSFSVKGATLALALAAASVEFAKVVEHQQAHAADQAIALETAKAVGSLIEVDESKDVQIQMNGWLSWGADPSPEEFTGASVTVSVSLAPRPPAA